MAKRNQQAKDLKIKAFSLRDDFLVLYDSYQSLCVLSCGSGLDADKVVGLLQVLNYRFDDLVQQFEDLIELH